MKRSLLLGWFCLIGLMIFAQNESVLMRINGDDVLLSEFVYAYQRHAECTSTTLSPKEYAELFILDRLKLDAAKAAGLDTTSAFRKQQEAYRSKLLRSYLTDERVTDSCARALYQKIQGQARNGQVLVMQIFRSLPQTIMPRRLEEEKVKMDSLYQAIQNRPEVDFAQWVEQYSDDKRCRWIGFVQTTSEFEDVAFSLSKGELSKPFFTPAGLHILKVVECKELPPYESVCDSLTNLLQCRSLDKGTDAVVERLKKEYQYAPVTDAIEELVRKGRTERTLFTIDGQAYTGETFNRFAASHPQAVKRQLTGFIAKSLLDYANKNADNRHPQLRNTLRQHAEDWLIAEIIRREIDLPATNDRAGLATYFKFHSSDYRWESPRYKGVVIHCVDKKNAKRAKKLLKKVPENEWVDILQKTFNTSGDEKIKVEQGLYAVGDNKYIDKLVFKKDDFEPLVSYPFTVVVGKKMKGPDDYREVIEQVRKDYRSYLNAYWTGELRKSAMVEINQEVLKTVNNN